MSSKVVIVTLLGAASIVAAGAGGYVALRRNAPAKPGPATIVRDVEPAPLAATRTKVARVDPPAERPAKTRPAESPKSTPPAKAPEPTVGAPVPNSGPLSPADPGAPEAREVRPDPAPVLETPRRPAEVTIASDSVIGIRLDSTLSSETARVEDKVAARVTRDLVVDGRTAISAGARLEGVVSAVEHAGKFKDRARLGVRFQSILFADGTRLPIETETIFREGGSATGSAASKVGASAAIGGILGAVIGGKKGAAIGSSFGAAGGTAAVMAGATPSVILQAGTPLTVRLTAPITVAFERQDD
jgi:hypothetical protein